MLPCDSHVSPAEFRLANKILNWGLVSTGESARKVHPGKVLYVMACCRLRPRLSSHVSIKQSTQPSGLDCSCVVVLLYDKLVQKLAGGMQRLRAFRLDVAADSNGSHQVRHSVCRHLAQLQLPGAATSEMRQQIRPASLLPATMSAEMEGACTHQAYSNYEDKMNSSVPERVHWRAVYEAARDDRFGRCLRALRPAVHRLRTHTHAEPEVTEDLAEQCR